MKGVALALGLISIICSCNSAKEYIIDTQFIMDSIKQQDFISIIDTITIGNPQIIKKKGLNVLLNDSTYYYLDQTGIELERLLFLFSVINCNDYKIKEYNFFSLIGEGKEITDELQNKLKEKKFYMERNSKFVLCQMNAHFYNVFCMSKELRNKSALFFDQDSREKYIKVAYSIDYTREKREPRIVIP